VAIRTLIQGGTILTMDPQNTVIRGDILLENGVIQGVGPSGSLPVSGSVRRLDAEDCFVMPGFVQAHVHLCQTLFRGFAEDLALLPWLSERIWPYEGAHDFESLTASAELGIAELLLGGTTAALDMGTVHETDAIFSAAERMGIRLTSGKAMMDQGDIRPGGLMESTEKSLQESAALAQKWHQAANGRLRYAFAPRFILSCTSDLLRETAKMARDLDCLLHTHASENPGEVEVVREITGDDNIVALHKLGLTGPDVVLAHCVWLSPEEEGILAETDTKVAHCPSTNLKLASGIAEIPELREHGIVVGIGADGAPCNNRLSAFTEMRLASLLQKPRKGPAAMPAKEVLRMATIDGARVLGIDHLVGSLETGKRADVTVVNGRRPHLYPVADPETTLVHGATEADVLHVFVDGQWLVRDGALRDHQIDGILDRSQSAIHQVLQRAGAK
jgi:5-methylthioadenosine/S-adenosylhomocysteine deaminase